MNRSGGGPQPLRPMSGNVFQSQSNASRNTPLGSQRGGQNGKLGSGSSWAFGMPIGGGGAPGLSNPSRPLSNFAQAIGGSSSQAPLDLSEFPSLGGPQPQQPSSVPQAWNTAIRQSQPPAPRPAPTQQPIQQRSVSGQTQSSQTHETPSLEAQYDGQSAGTGRAPSEHAANDSEREFPPLGGQINGRSNGFDRTDGDSTFGSDTSRSARPTNPPGIDTQPFGSSLQQLPIGQPAAAQPPPPQQSTNFASQILDPPLSSQPPQLKEYADMTEDEKWGMPGLLAKLPGRSEKASTLAMGVDLNELGLDLDSPNPLFPDFASPFHDSRSSRPVIPEFTLPPAYSVNNVPQLATRMPAFSDETLFWIFYQFTRDVLQELAAGELYSRDWRWHKRLQQWMMKDSQMAAPIRVSERSERGVYIFFDANNWRRERREFVLNYDDLDQRHGATQPAAL